MTGVQDTVWTRFDRHIIEVLVLLTMAALLLAPPFMTASVGVVAALVSAITLALVRFSARGPVARETWIVLGVSAVAVALLTVTSFMATDASHSFFGKPGQHGGAATWIALLALAAVMVVRSRPGDLGRVLRAVALASAFLALAALADAAGLMDSFRFSQEAAGLLESSISLGQALVLGVGCSIAWALTSRSTDQQIAAWGSGVLALVALVAAGARSGLVALVVAAALVAAVRWVGGRDRNAMITWGAALAAAMVVMVSVGWFAIGPSNLDQAEQWASATNQRTIIWASAYGGAAQSPVIGRGPDQFSAWAAWDSDPQIGLSKAGTYDPHSVPLAWLVAGGIAGLLLFAAAVGLGLGRLLTTFFDRGFALPVGAVVAGLLGWAVSLASAWMAPVAAFMAVLVFGAFIAAGDRGRNVPAPSPVAANVVAGVAAIVSLAVLVAWAPGLAEEMAWASETESGTATIAAMTKLAVESGDPSAAAVTANSLAQEGQQNPASAEANLALAAQLETVLEPSAPWHVDAAYAGMSLEVLRVGALSQGSWDDAEAYIEAGKLADPTSGLWDYVAAAQAERLGLPDIAAEHAADALEYPLPDPVRSYLEGLAATQ